MNIAELVYESLIGELVDSIDDVPNAFASGSFCEARYGEMLDAYERLRERLGVVDEVDEVETIIDSLLAIQWSLCLKMFELASIVL